MSDPALDAESQSEGIVAASAVLIFLPTIFVALRLYTREVIVRFVGIEDLAIVITLLLAIGTAIGTIIQARNGLGQHTWVVAPDSAARLLNALYVTILIYNPAQIMLKISFILLYRRIFTGWKTRRICLWLLVFVAIWGVLQELLAGLACTPLAKLAPNMADKCLATLPIWYLTSVMNVVTDFIIFSVPLPTILRLKLRHSQKAALTALFSLGFFTCIVSIIRLFTLRASLETDDPMWVNSATSIWSEIELTSGILCASLITLRPFWRKVFPRIFHPTTVAPTQKESESSAFKHIPNETKLETAEHLQKAEIGTTFDQNAGTKAVVYPSSDAQLAAQSNHHDKGESWLAASDSTLGPV